MNKFNLELQIVGPDSDDTDNEYTLEAKIFVDDIEISGEYVSLYDLINSLKKSGEHFIYNCSCGEPGCARIANGVKVKHRANVISWKTRIPASYFKYKNYYTYLKTVKNRNFQFSKSDMIENIKNECERILHEVTVEDSHIRSLGSDSGLKYKFNDLDDNSYFLRNGLDEIFLLKV